MTTLRMRMDNDMLVRGMAERTREAYLAAVTRLARHYRRAPDHLSPQEVQAYLVHMLREEQRAWSTCSIAVHAFRFFYHTTLGRPEPTFTIPGPKQPKRLPEILSPGEVRRLLDAMSGVCALMAELLYGAGLRLAECASLRVRDLDFESNRITVREGKGRKDRVTVLPRRARTALMEHLDRVRVMHERDVARGFGEVPLPEGVAAARSSNAAREWPWQFVFPAPKLMVAEGDGRVLRPHLCETVLQKAVRHAALKAGIARPASCHTLRHYSASRTMPSDVGGHSRWVGNRASRWRWDRPITRHSLVGATDG